jgi:hypothetical protein
MGAMGRGHSRGPVPDRTLTLLSLADGTDGRGRAHVRFARCSCQASRVTSGPWLSLALQTALWYGSWRRHGIPGPRFWRVFGTDARRRPPTAPPNRTPQPGPRRPPPSTRTVDPLVRARMRMSGPGSATMHESPAGVAQLAEQPSCKRQASGSIPLTGSQISEGVQPSRSSSVESNVESNGPRGLPC